MKNRIVLIGLLVFITLTSGYSQNMLVEDAGRAYVNGLYLVSGEYLGKNYYVYNSYYFLYCRSETPRWYLGSLLGSTNQDSIYYYIDSSANTPDGLSLSSLGNLGSSPGPTVGETPLPVEACQASAKIEGQSVLLQWTTQSEKDNAGFFIERAEWDTRFETIASYLTHPELVGSGTTSNSTDYRLIQCLNPPIPIHSTRRRPLLTN